MNTSKATSQRPTFNEAALLESFSVYVRGASSATTFVTNIDYDAKGRRERIDYGNGVATTYAYDPKTFCLSELRSTRSSGSSVLQDLSYTYDVTGISFRFATPPTRRFYFRGASPRARVATSTTPPTD